MSRPGYHVQVVHVVASAHFVKADKEADPQIELRMRAAQMRADAERRRDGAQDIDLSYRAMKASPAKVGTRSHWGPQLSKGISPKQEISQNALSKSLTRKKVSTKRSAARVGGGSQRSGLYLSQGGRERQEGGLRARYSHFNGQQTVRGREYDANDLTGNAPC